MQTFILVNQLFADDTEANKKWEEQKSSSDALMASFAPDVPPDVITDIAAFNVDNIIEITKSDEHTSSIRTVSGEFFRIADPFDKVLVAMANPQKEVTRAGGDHILIITDLVKI